MKNRAIEEAMKATMTFKITSFADNGGDDGTEEGEDDGGDEGAVEDDDDDNKESEKKYTDADVDRLVKQRLARERKAGEKKARQQAEAEKLKSMTAAEKRDAEFEQMKARLASLEAEKNQAEMLSTASDILKDAGVNVSSKLVAHLIAETADETKANVDEFVKLFNDAVNKGVKAAMKAAGSSPKRKGGSSDSGEWTKEKIYEVKDPIKRQQLIKEHWELFKN